MKIETIKKLPNILSMARILSVPVVLCALMLPGKSSAQYILAAMLFVLSAATDSLDGHIARKYNLITDFGKFLDPIADKLLVTAALLSLTGVSLMYLWATLIILAREFIVSGIRMLAASKGVVIAAGTLGKAKMVVQTIAIIVLLVAGVIPESLTGFRKYLYSGGNIVMLAAVILTIVSGIEYVYKNRNVLFTNSK